MWEGVLIARQALRQALGHTPVDGNSRFALSYPAVVPSSCCSNHLCSIPLSPPSPSSSSSLLRSSGPSLSPSAIPPLPERRPRFTRMRKMRKKMRRKRRVERRMSKGSSSDRDGSLCMVVVAARALLLPAPPAADDSSHCSSSALTLSLYDACAPACSTPAPTPAPAIAIRYLLLAASASSARLCLCLSARMSPFKAQPGCTGGYGLPVRCRAIAIPERRATASVRPLLEVRLRILLR